MRVITFKISDRLLDELDAFCFRHNKPRSEIIRKAIEEYLLNHGKIMSKVKVRYVRLEP